MPTLPTAWIPALTTRPAGRGRLGRAGLGRAGLGRAGRRVPLSLLVLPLFLSSLLLPLGLSLDLCACAEGGHALLCGASEPAQAKAPEARGSCCSAPAPTPREGCADEGEPCPGCPVVELPDVQLDLPAPPSSFDYTLALSGRGSDRVDLGHGFRPAWTALGSRAPPGKVPRYLLYGRIRC